MTKARTPERTVNRYYDPTTDQFLSIDPAVASTDQPYVFTNDNSLNATDPLGLNPFRGIFHFIARVYDRSRHDISAANDAASSFINNESQTILCNGGAGGGPFGRSLHCPGNGSSTSRFAAGGALKFVHPDSTLRSSSGYKYWSDQTTEAIVRSLAPGTSRGLLVNPNGVIMDGNSRVFVLKGRGYDIENLPRDIHIPYPLGEPLGDRGLPAIE